MNQSNLVMLTLREIEERLGQAFTPEQTAALIFAFDPIHRAILEQAKGMAELKQALAILTVQVQKLAEAQARTEQRLDKVEQRLDKVEQRLDKVEQRLDKVEQRLDKVEQRLGYSLSLQMEQDYARKAYAYFGTFLRRIQVVPLPDIIDDLYLHLSREEVADLLPLDLLVRGRLHEQPDGPELWLAVEISATVDRNDIARAQQRAALLQKVGYVTIPVVAGREMTQGAQEMAAQERILTLQNGRSLFWEEALHRALPA
jgi:hypothetical protein